MGKQWKQWQTLFWGAPKSLQIVMQPWISKTLASWKKSYDQPGQFIKKQRHYLPTKVRLVKTMVFPVVMYGCDSLDHKESGVPKNWCFWTVVLEKTLQSPLDNNEIKPVHPKGNQSWIFIGRTDAEAETPIFWPSDASYWLIGKRPWCWERLKAGGAGANRGWGGWMASPTQWTWVWVNYRSRWWTGRPGVLQSMGSKASDTAEWLNWCDFSRYDRYFSICSAFCIPTINAGRCRLTHHSSTCSGVKALMRCGLH